MYYVQKDLLSIFESLPGLYLILKPDAPRFTIEAVSDAYADATLTKRDEIVGKGMFEVFPDNPKDPQANGVANLKKSLLKVLKYKKPHTMAVQKYDIRTPKGGFEERYWSPMNTPVLNNLGEVTHIIHSAKDVTQNIKMTNQQYEDGQEIAQLRERHNTLFEQDFVAITVLRGSDYIIEQANPLVCQLWGRTQRQVLGKPLFKALPETVGQGLEELLNGVLTTGEQYIGTEIPVKLRRGGESGKQLETVYFNFIYIPMYDTDGTITGITVLANDVTEQVNNRTKLVESEERFRNLADTTPMYIAMADEAGNAVYFNKPWLEFTGKKMEEMVGLGWLSVLHPEDAPEFEREFKHAFEHHIPINKQYRFRRADGKYRWMLAVGAPRFTPDHKFIGYYGTYTDFHDLKLAQLAVQESETRLLTLANNISQLVWTLDKDGNPFWFNQRWYEYTGMNPAFPPKIDWDNLFHPKHVGRMMETLKYSLENGHIWENASPMKGNDGKYRWFLSRAVPIRDEKGNIVEWFGTSTDIDDLRRTTKRKSELEHITASLKQQREQLLALNQAKDEFISLASHQLRTPATGVKQFIGMLLEGYAGELSDSQRHFLQTAYESNERQLTIVNDLLKVARVDSGKMRLRCEKLDIIPLIREIIDEQAAKFKANKQKIEFTYETTSLVVSAEEALLRMALENLVDNAHKYTFPGKSIEVLALQFGDTVQIAVKDEGTGINKSDIDKLFHKFSRIDNPLSASAGGTGLGLYWVKRVIDLHGGKIDVESEVGHGTTFTVSLPVHSD